MTNVTTIRVEGTAGGTFEHVHVTADAPSADRPVILVLPNVLGVKDVDVAVSTRLASEGWDALVVDLYGVGQRATRADADPARFMNVLNADRTLMRGRLEDAVRTAQALPDIDRHRVAAVGFCFGGKAVLDLARSGADLRAGVSFHGVFDAPDWAPASQVTMPLLLCHGWDDPLAPPAAVTALADELTRLGADWHLLAHGHAGHAFTDVALDDRARGFFFDAAANARSWDAALRFLHDRLGATAP